MKEGKDPKRAQEVIDKLQRYITAFLISAMLLVMIGLVLFLLYSVVFG